MWSLKEEQIMPRIRSLIIEKVYRKTKICRQVCRRKNRKTEDRYVI